MSYVVAGDVPAVRKLVASGKDLLDEMEDTSPLTLAIEGGNIDMVAALLDLGHAPDLGGIVVPLAEAAQSGRLDIIELLLARGADVNAQGEEGETALMWAAGAGHVDITKRLIAAGADIRKTDSGGEDALHYALKGRSNYTIDFLLPHFPEERRRKVARQRHLLDAAEEKKSPLAARLDEAIARPAMKGKKSQTGSLIAAHSSGNPKKFLQLLAAGADPNETNAEGTTILGLIAHSSSVYDLVKPLLKAGADPNRGELFRPLNGAAGHGSKEAVRLLLKAGADVNWADPDGDTPLMSAAAGGNKEIVQLLLRTGANPNAENHKGQTAYWRALNCCNSEAADALAPVTADADDARRPWRKNKEGKSREMCFLASAKGGDVEHVKRLLSQGLPVDVADASADTALHHAASNGDLEMIRTLLDASAPLEAEGSADLTPLLAAAARGQTGAVKLLLDAGADVHAKTDSILCYVCENEHCRELVELLLRAGAKVNAAGGYMGTTPLLVAIERRRGELVPILLNAGASLRAKNGMGWTPLLNAAIRCDLKTVKFLIEAGADLKAVDKSGKNAYDLASQWGKKAVANYLKSLFRQT